MSGEWFLLVNVVMNTGCLLTAGITCARMIRPARLICAAMMGAVLSLGMATLGGAPSGIPAIAVIGACMSAHAFGLSGAIRCLPMLMLCGLTASGLARVLQTQGISPYFLLPICALGIGASLRALQRVKTVRAQRVTLRVTLRGKHTVVGAIADSGNLLYDPVSSLPVVVAPYALIKNILPSGIRPENPDTLPRGFRFLSVNTAIGSRLMMCFKPQSMFIRNGSVWQAANAIVAISPDPRLQFALTPAHILEYTGGAICLSTNGNE